MGPTPDQDAVADAAERVLDKAAERAASRAEASASSFVKFVPMVVAFLGFLFSSFATTVGVTFWLNSKLAVFDKSFALVDVRLQRIEEKLPVTWTLDEQRAWAAILQALNPDIKIPPIR